MEGVASFVTDPVTVDLFIDPWLKTRNAVLVSLDADVAARAAARTDRRRLLQVPDAHFEAKIAIRKRADRADVDNIASQGIVENRAGKKSNGRMVAAVDDSQLVGMGHFLQEAHAASAFDAPLAVENNVGAKDLPLAFMLFFFFEAAGLPVMLHIVVLEPALPGLIANGAVQRVIDEQELHDGLAHREDLGTLGQHGHALGDLRVAGNLQLGHFFDFHEAHAAIAGNRQFRMVTVVRDRNSRFSSRLNDGFALGGADFFAVDGDLDRFHHQCCATVHRFSRIWSSNSARNFRIKAPAGIAAASPKGQIVFPIMLPLTLRIKSRSSSSPLPLSIR
jgi:hypothetical protein